MTHRSYVSIAFGSVFALTLLVGATFASAAVVWSSGFESSTFIDWTSRDTQWSQIGSDYRPGSAGNKSAKISEENNASVRVIRKDGLSTLGLDTVTAKYWYRVSDQLNVGDYVKLQFSTNNGATWTDAGASIPSAASASWAQQTIVLPASASNAANFSIRFVGFLSKNGGGDKDEVHIDDLEITASTIVVDTDADTIPDSTDNCPSIANTDQSDVDDDSTGDACDTESDLESCSDEVDNNGNEATDLSDESCAAFIPTLTVTKKVINVDGGTMDASDFTLQIKNFFTDAVVSSAAGSETGHVYQLSPGTYDVSELPAANYSMSFTAGTCSDVTLEIGDQKTCEVTNTYIKPAQCADGIDNDNDGLIDANDLGCMNAQDNNETNEVIPPPLAACEDGIDNDADEYTDYPSDQGCSSPSDTDETDVEVPQSSATIVATKIVCDDEADLPNYGGGVDLAITSTTASDWLESHPGCHLEQGWKFQYAPGYAYNPGDAFVNMAGDPWLTSPATNESGVTSWQIPLIEGTNIVSVREVLLNGYIPFTNEETPDNSDTVSAEIYCNDDVYNYDNLEYINAPVDGGTYYCVAWNVVASETEPTDLCPNIEEVQEVIPEGYVLEGEMCVEENNDEEEVIDVCSNIPEVQESVPEGMNEVEGICTPEGNGGGDDEEENTNETPSGSTGGGSGGGSTPPQCADGSDNDSDGKADFPNDPGCESSLDNDESGNGASGSGASAGNGLGTTTGEVLGATTEEPALPPSCGIYISEYMKYGKKNNSEEVKKLQTFLNEVMGTNIPVTGYFGTLTRDLVKKFQKKYHAEILKPWIDAGWNGKDLENGTGYVFKTTKRWVNLMKCQSLNIPLPDLKAS